MEIQTLGIGFMTMQFLVRQVVQSLPIIVKTTFCKKNGQMNKKQNKTQSQVMISVLC